MFNPLGDTPSRRFELRKFADEKTLADSVAEQWISDLEKTGNGAYFAALSGGRIARRFFQSIAGISGAFPRVLDRVHFFWADERCVAPNHPESNFGLAQDHLVSPLKLSTDRIHRIRGEIGGSESASEAELDLRRLVPADPNGRCVLDMVFLGMGEDGHVASLFPGVSDGSIQSSAMYRTVMATKPPPVRITLTYEAIAAARQVWILASGPNKEAALRNSLSPEGLTPLAKVLGIRQETVIFTDIRLPETGNF